MWYESMHAWIDPEQSDLDHPCQKQSDVYVDKECVIPSGSMTSCT
jgi:hypothetical protein